MRKKESDFSLELNYFKRSDGSYYYDLIPSKAFEKMGIEFLFEAFLTCLKDLGIVYSDSDYLAIHLDNFGGRAKITYLENAQKVFDASKAS